MNARMALLIQLIRWRGSSYTEGQVILPFIMSYYPQYRSSSVLYYSKPIMNANWNDAEAEKKTVSFF